jgi:hypothetical protein
MKKILFIATALLISTQVNAGPGCKEKDLNGKYVMYQNSVALANLHTGRCEINILKGVVSGTCAFTATKDGVITPGFSGPAYGTAAMNTNCSAVATISFDPDLVHIDSYFDLQFTPDKQSFIGQWTNNKGLLGTSAGTRSPRLPVTPASHDHHSDDNYDNDLDR